MAITDSPWDAHFARLNETADNLVGDRIAYAVDGVNFVALAGYVIDVNEGIGGIDDMDVPVSNRKRVKISKNLVARPLRTHRLRHPRLGDGTFRPSSEGEPVTVGGYWLFDVQKV